MSTDLSDKSKLVGKKYKFVVSSAEEAVLAIKKHLGDDAKVLSVNQVGGKGLARFLSSPKLEVIATIPLPDEDLQNTPSTNDKEAQPEKLPTDTTSSNRALLTEEPLGKVNLPKTIQQLYGMGDKAPLDEGPFVRTGRARPSRHPSNTLSLLLQKSHFPESLIQGLEQTPQWSALASEPLGSGLAGFVQMLKEIFANQPRRPLTKRVAFIGAPGVGKTTMLCKALTQSVFIDNEDVKVVKFESESPNSDEALSVFCEALGVALLKESEVASEDSSMGRLYVDVPGTLPFEDKALTLIRDKLNLIEVDSRVLVLNAAYEGSILQAHHRMGDILEATHVAFTHVDELVAYGNLWPFILRGGLSPLFLSYGPNVAGDYTEEVFQYLIDKTFPAML